MPSEYQYLFYVCQNNQYFGVGIIANHNFARKMKMRRVDLISQPQKQKKLDGTN